MQDPAVPARAHTHGAQAVLGLTRPSGMQQMTILLQCIVQDGICQHISEVTP